MVVPPTSPAAAPGAGPERPAPGRTGVWLVGARGSVATTAIAGAAAARAPGWSEPIGCVTERPALRRCRPAGVGGPGRSAGTTWSCTPLDEAGRAAGRRPGCMPAPLLAAAAADLRAVDAEIRAGYAPGDADGGAGGRGRAAGRRPRSTSGTGTAWTGWSWSTCRPPSRRTGHGPEHASRWPRWPAALRAGAPLPPSSLYAYAAFTAGCPFVDFTPSTGLRLPALRRAGPAGGPAVRRHRRQDRRDAGQGRARADVHGPGAAGPVLVGHQPARRRRRRQPGRPARGRPASRSPRQRGLAEMLGDPVAGPTAHRQRARPRRLEDRLGPRVVRGLPRRADEPAVHLAGLRLGAGRAAGAGPGPAARPGARGRARRARWPRWRSSSRTRSAATSTASPRSTTELCAWAAGLGGDRPGAREAPASSWSGRRPR